MSNISWCWFMCAFSHWWENEESFMLINLIKVFQILIARLNMKKWEIYIFLFYTQLISSQTRKTTAIRRAAVRETINVSHGHISSTPKTCPTSGLGYLGVSGGPQLGSNPWSLSDIRTKILRGLKGTLTWNPNCPEKEPSIHCPYLSKKRNL